MRRWLVCWLVLYGVAAHAAGNSIVGDPAELAARIAAANDQPGFHHNIRVHGTFRFGPQHHLPVVTGLISIIGGVPAPRFEAVDGGPDQLLRVAAAAELKLSGIVIAGFRLSDIHTHDGPLLDNRGRLVVQDLRFENVTGIVGGGFCCSHERYPVIRNFGALEVRRTAFLDSGVDSNFPGSLVTNDGGEALLETVLAAQFADQRLAGSVANFGGKVRIVNATLMIPGTTIFSSPGALTEVGNSIIGGAPVPPDLEIERCDGPVASLGHNLVAGNPSCGFAAPGDRVVTDLGLTALRLQRSPRELPTPVLAPAIGSAARDSADPDLCPGVDLLGRIRPVDSDGDGEPVCERGAVEVARVALTDGGANGLYYVPEHDGHYLYLLENSFNTLLIWNTFDRNGNQAWILATGDLIDGRYLDAPAFINENGVLTPEGPVNIDRAQPWGRLRLELESCNRGRVRFDSDRPGFGSGEFAIVRLAAVRQLGCLEQTF